MKIRHLASAVFLAVGLTVSLPSFSSLTCLHAPMTSVQAADAWNKDSNGYYYLKDGKKLTGLQVIAGSTYYFNSSGYRVTGPALINGKAYYFRPENGVLDTGRSGLFQGTSTSTLYYLNETKDGTLAKEQWIRVNGSYYYADATGRICLGTIALNGKLYHQTREGRMTAYGKSSYDNKYYYAAANGKLKTGQKTIGGKKYYFNTTTGERQTGPIKIGKYTYFFDATTGKQKTGWVNMTDSNDVKKYYYYNSKGRLVTGWKTIKNKKYYLNPKDGGARVQDGWLKISGKTYYFNEKGVLQSGFVTINGKRYYLSSSGTKKKGWQTINGLRYHFDKKTGEMQTGWYNSSGGYRYYLNPSKTSSTYGVAVTGWKKISGETYYFNPDGRLRFGWLLENMRYYYLDKTTGKMLTGTHTIDGKSYDFGTSGSISASISGTYTVRVNRKECFVVIYRGDTPVKAFVCSTSKDGTSTPVGTFTLRDKLRWHELMGPSWGQYCSHITDDILFHSVTYSQNGNVHSLSASAYNMLGKPASHGCIRLTVKSAKWMYDNLPIGTKVIISDNLPAPKYVPIETAQKIPLDQNYDPTDPNA